MHLIIGGDSFVGKAVHTRLILANVPVGTTTRRRLVPSVIRPPYDLDLRDITTDKLPKAKFVYLIAAITGFAQCEGNPIAWRINVDGPITIARHYHKSARIIFISSDCVEWSGAAYARQKAQTENYIQSINGVIIRPTRIIPERVDAFAKFVVDCALENRVGVNLWK